MLKQSIVLLFIAASAPAMAQRPAYDLSSENLKGPVKEITQSEFKVTFNDEEFTLGNRSNEVFINSNFSNTYSESGKLMLSNVYGVDGEILYKTSCRYNDSDKLIEVDFFATEPKSKSKDMFHYNSEGNLKDAFHYMNDEFVMHSFFLYSNDNEYLGVKKIDENGEPFQTISIKRSAYKIVEMQLDKNGHLTKKEIDSLDANGDLFRRLWFDEKGEIYRIYEYKNLEGDQSEKKIYNELNQLTNRIIFDSNGFISEYYGFAADGTIEISEEYTYEIDEHGNWTACLLKTDGNHTHYVRRDITYFNQTE